MTRDEAGWICGRPLCRRCDYMNWYRSLPWQLQAIEDVRANLREGTGIGITTRMREDS